MRSELGAVPVEGSQLGRSQFTLRRSSATLSTVIRALERSKAQLQVQAYSCLHISNQLSDGDVRNLFECWLY